MDKKVLLESISYITKLNPKSIFVGSVASYFNGVKSVDEIKDIDICVESLGNLDKLEDIKHHHSPTNLFGKDIITGIYNGVNIDIFLTPLSFDKIRYLKEYNINIINLKSQVEHYNNVLKTGRLKNKFQNLVEIHQKTLETLN